MNIILKCSFHMDQLFLLWDKNILRHCFVSIERNTCQYKDYLHLPDGWSTFGLERDQFKAFVWTGQNDIEIQKFQEIILLNVKCSQSAQHQCTVWNAHIAILILQQYTSSLAAVFKSFFSPLDWLGHKIKVS